MKKITKLGMNEKLITTTIIVFSVGVFVGVSLEAKLENIVALIVPLFAAFLGAYFAFALQDKKQREDLIEKRIDAGNGAIFEVIRIYNTYLNYKQQFIDPHFDDPARFLSIPPIVGFNDSLDIDYDSLSHLLRCANPNVLGELSSFN